MTHDWDLVLEQVGGDQGVVAQDCGGVSIAERNRASVIVPLTTAVFIFVRRSENSRRHGVGC